MFNTEFYMDLAKKQFDSSNEYCIDLIQNNKKFWVEHAVKNSTMKSVLIDFVDAQTAYTKSAAKTMTEMALKLTKEITAAPKTTGLTI